jgi:hypothetical protein
MHSDLEGLGLESLDSSKFVRDPTFTSFIGGGPYGLVN